MKKILIPTDFSKTSMNAIIYAMRLFKYERCEFTIMNAYADEVYENIEDFEEFKKVYEDKIDTKLQKEVAEMLKRSPNPKHDYCYVSCFGSLVDEVNEIVEKDNVDIVVMGTKGKTNDRNITFGSNTLQVMKYVKCPVLAVPVDFNEEYPQNILFPTDYMVPFKRRELKLLSIIAKGFVASINFFYISNFKGLSHRQLDNREFLHCCFENNKTSYLQAKGKDTTKTINEAIVKHEIDMLVMVNQRHSYLENILYTSDLCN